MDRIARKVAAAYGLRVAHGDWQPEFPAWATRLAWSGFDPEQDSYENLVDEDYVEPKTDAELYDEARESIAILLPNFLKLLGNKYHDRYHMISTHRGLRMTYYFATRHPLETFVLDLNVARGLVGMALHFVPHDAHGRPQVRDAVHTKDRNVDPEMAGMALMRLARKLLSAV